MARLAYARLSDTLLGGPMPYTERHVRALSDEGVTAVINLCEDTEYWAGERDLIQAQYTQAGIVEHRLSVKDGATVPAEILEQAASVAASGETLYVHCRGGRERSATVCAAIFTRQENLDPAEAVSRTQAKNPVFKPLPWQVEGLTHWALQSNGGTASL
jgi:atypical dual specificity phosphatase